MKIKVSNHKITIGDREVDCEIRKHPRSRSMRLAIHSETAISVTIPRFVLESMALRFVQEKKDWILSAITKIAQCERITMSSGKEDMRRKARILIHDRLPYFAKKLGVEYRRVYIRDQSSIWGSCSPAKNLSFNLRLAALTPEQADYIIVHELCHLREMNHSAKFWALVASVLSDYQKRRREIKRISINK